MDALLVLFAFLLLAAGILGAILPVLPGPPLSYIGLLLLQWSGQAGTGTQVFSLFFLLVWAGITIAVTIMDYVLPSIMTKKFGGSRAASIGSFLGLLAGIFFFPPWGMITGPFIGALLGELVYNSAQGRRALKVACGAFLAFFIGSGAKMIVCSLMLFYAIRVMF